MATTTSKRKPTTADRLRVVQHTAALLKLASDPTRLQILLMLAERKYHVGALCEPLVITQPAVSHHLALLRHGRMVEPRRDGKQSFYELTELGQKLAAIAKKIGS